MSKVLAFTGHRPPVFGGYDENRPQIQAAKAALHLGVSKAIQHGFDEFISGMALGVDTWAAEEVLLQRLEHKHIRLLAFIPWEGQGWNWVGSSIPRYKAILDSADEVYIRAQQVTDWSHLPQPSKPKDDWKALLQQRNVDMVDRASAVMAIWNGDPGGTGNCVTYARKVQLRRDLKIVRYDPRAGAWV